MAFVDTDLYLTSAVTNIYNTVWPVDVTKYNSSTFYNWEQDNEPIYDLEDRTDVLWQRLGRPYKDGSLTPVGQMYVVSADASFAVGSKSTEYIFADLSSVLNVLPNTITYPIIIEVASFGNIGELNLKNIKVDTSYPGAGLEIINRNFGRTTKAGGATFSGTVGTGAIASNDLYSTLINTKSVAASTTVASSNTDVRWQTSNRAWTTRLSHTGNLLTNNGYLSFNATSLLSPTDGVFLNNYDNTEDPTILNYDITVSSYDGAVTFQRASEVVGDSVVSMVYGNYLKSVQIENCAGPIYIRNFCVDGGLNTTGTITQYTDTGFGIKNSNVILENCMAMRCKKNGFHIVNSDVKIRRGLFGVRNYTVNSSTRDMTTESIGLLAEDSVINVESITSPVTVSGIDIPIQFAYNIIGMRLINSIFKGGDSIKEISSSEYVYTNGTPTFVQAFRNNKYGIDLINSHYSHLGTTECFNNDTGLHCINSNAALPAITCQYNQSFGLLAENSIITHNPENKRINNINYSDTTYGTIGGQFTYSYNGQNIKLSSSKLNYVHDNNMTSKIGATLVAGAFGITRTQDVKTQLPSIEITNRSEALLTPGTYQTTQRSVATYPEVTYHEEGGVFGGCISVNDGSKVKTISDIRGLQILGPNSYGRSTALVYVDNNSVYEINGPTLLAQAGINILADNGSVIKINPHRSSNGALDVSGWGLTNSAAHTGVEMHSWRSCIVVDNKSILQAEDLGHFAGYWPASATSSVDFTVTNASSYTSAGFLQFYPNGQYPAAVNALTNGVSVGTPAWNTGGKYFLVDWSDSNAPNDHAQYSTGGMCVRALNGSKVKIVNVHFPAGWSCPSGIYYDASSGSECDKLRIWNICGNSELDATYCTVSGTYPPLLNYYRGPSAVYTSGANLVARAMPASVPDTGTMSVLDFYGLSGTVQAASNLGPFRLYFSPESRAKFLTTTSSNSYDTGVPYQVISQGYNPSSQCSGASGIRSLVSSIYPDLFTASTYTVSAFYNKNYVHQIRLDESAMNIFANAKHNTTDKSGRVKLVSVVHTRDGTSVGSQAFDSSNLKYGKGLKSTETFDLRRDN